MPDIKRRAHGFVRGAVVVAVGLAVLACDSAASVPINPGLSPTAFVSASPAAIPRASAAPIGRKYIRGLVAAFERDPFITHVVQTAKVTSGNMILSTGMTLDLAARELKATMVTKVAGKTTKQVLVVAGKYVYVRLDSRAWIRKPRSTFEKSGVDMITPLRLIRDPADLKYVGAEKIDGHMRQHLTASRILPYGTLNGATGQYDKFDVWTAEDGTPVLVKIALSATAANGLKVKGTTEFRFSHFGGPIKIVAPKIAK